MDKIIWVAYQLCSMLGCSLQGVGASIVWGRVKYDCLNVQQGCCMVVVMMV